MASSGGAPAAAAPRVAPLMEAIHFMRRRTFSYAVYKRMVGARNPMRWRPALQACQLACPARQAPRRAGAVVRRMRRRGPSRRLMNRGRHAAGVTLLPAGPGYDVLCLPPVPCGAQAAEHCKEVRRSTGGLTDEAPAEVCRGGRKSTRGSGRADA
jgi:hypothetical protein